MKRAIIMLAFVLAVGGTAQAQNTYVLLSEDFEGLKLGPSVEEAAGTPDVWTDTPPPGWVVDESGVPGAGNPITDGVTEWAGWAFADKDFWIATDGQRREEFALGQGTIAVADSDEYDDSSHPAGSYDTYLSTPAIDISSARAGTIRLKFDSSWRPEVVQTANITVQYDGGNPIEVLRWESETGAHFKDDNSTSETITVNLNNPAGAASMVLTFGYFNTDNNWWWAIDNIEVTAERSAERAYNPNPRNGTTEVTAKTKLSWTPGEYVGGLSPKHKVILSDNFDAVRDGTAVVATQDANSFDATGLLDYSTTYYWQIDEANSTSVWDEGSIWHFTTEAVAYVIPSETIVATASSVGQPEFGPENTINGSGLDENDLHSTLAEDMWLSGNELLGAWIQYEFDKAHRLHEMWVWNSNQTFENLFGFGLKEVTIEYSTNGTDWTTLAGVPQFTKAPGKSDYAHDTTVDFGGAVAKYVKLTATGNWGGILPQYSLSEVRFFSIPVSAREPSPEFGTANVAVDGTLSWRAGREAVTHNVYLSMDKQAVIDGTVPAVSVTDASYSLDLDLGQTYNWRIDEVNEAETPTVWQGDVWEFTTQEFIVVDGFEDYNDYPPHEIYSTWLDGYENPANGSQVGNLTPPLAETTIVHDGVQSMPLFYSNTGGAAFSEAERTFVSPQNWTKHSVTTLSIWFHGTAGNTGQMYIKIDGSKISYDGQGGNIAIPGWQVWNIDLSSSGLNLQSVTKLAIGIDGNSAAGTLYFDDIALYAVAPAPPNEWRIADDADDVEERIGPNNGAIDSSSSDLEMPYEDAGQGDPQIVGVRFTGIPIPQGATITDAWVQFQVDETKGGTDPVNLIIQGELSTSPAGFSSTAGDISSRTTTAAQVQWSVPNWINVGDAGPDQRTPNLASIIQEIVNQPGWAGDGIVLIIRDDPANPSTGIRCAEAGPGGDSALLHIDYQ